MTWVRGTGLGLADRQEDVDTNLRTRIRAGDHAAFGDLFDACARSVYNHAFRLTGDWATAEDVVSLTFLDAWRLRDRLDAQGGSRAPGCWASPPTSRATPAAPREDTPPPSPGCPATAPCATTPTRWPDGWTTPPGWTSSAPP
ncbi:hypothetical protein SFUMM280S_03264 [Streptomyces fumanus]